MLAKFIRTLITIILPPLGSFLEARRQKDKLLEFVYQQGNKAVFLSLGLIFILGLALFLLLPLLPQLSVLIFSSLVPCLILAIAVAWCIMYLSRGMGAYLALREILPPDTEEMSDIFLEFAFIGQIEIESFIDLCTDTLQDHDKKIAIKSFIYNREPTNNFVFKSDTPRARQLLKTFITLAHQKTDGISYEKSWQQCWKAYLTSLAAADDQVPLEDITPDFIRDTFLMLHSVYPSTADLNNAIKQIFKFRVQLLAIKRIRPTVTSDLVLSILKNPNYANKIIEKVNYLIRQNISCNAFLSTLENLNKQGVAIDDEIFLIASNEEFLSYRDVPHPAMLVQVISKLSPEFRLKKENISFFASYITAEQKISTSSDKKTLQTTLEGIADLFNVLHRVNCLKDIAELVKTINLDSLKMIILFIKNVLSHEENRTSEKITIILDIAKKLNNLDPKTIEIITTFLGKIPLDKSMYEYIVQHPAPILAVDAISAINESKIEIDYYTMTTAERNDLIQLINILKEKELLPYFQTKPLENKNFLSNMKNIVTVLRSFESTQLFKQGKQILDLVLVYPQKNYSEIHKLLLIREKFSTLLKRGSSPPEVKKETSRTTSSTILNTLQVTNPKSINLLLLKCEQIILKYPSPAVEESLYALVETIRFSLPLLEEILNNDKFITSLFSGPNINTWINILIELHHIKLLASGTIFLVQKKIRNSISNGDNIFKILYELKILSKNRGIQLENQVYINILNKPEDDLNKILIKLTGLKSLSSTVTRDDILLALGEVSGKKTTLNPPPAIRTVGWMVQQLFPLILPVVPVPSELITSIPPQQGTNDAEPQEQELR